GSMAVLSSSTIYTVIQSKSSQYDKIRDKKYVTKPKPIQKIDDSIFDTYIEALPSVEEYIDSNESYEDNLVISKYIFSIFSREEIQKINHLRLSKLDKLLFIREMLYFESDERTTLIDNMINSQDKVDEKIFYKPPKNTINLKDQIRLYIRSLIEPGEITKLIITNTDELIVSIKEKVGVLFNYDLEDFLLSSGGILLAEDKKVHDYDIDDDDESALIPSRKGNK
ncbi:MAG: hypothetical protein ACW99E_23495, partial [Promethearchaeota archaeon]